MPACLRRCRLLPLMRHQAVVLVSAWVWALQHDLARQQTSVNTEPSCLRQVHSTILHTASRGRVEVQHILVLICVQKSKVRRGMPQRCALSARL